MMVDKLKAWARGTGSNTCIGCVTMFTTAIAIALTTYERFGDFGALLDALGAAIASLAECVGVVPVDMVGLQNRISKIRGTSR